MKRLFFSLLLLSPATALADACICKPDDPYSKFPLLTIMLGVGLVALTVNRLRKK